MTITNVPTNHVIAVSTNSSGAFDSGALIPGNYTTQFSAPGFGAALVPAVVPLGNTTTVHFNSERKKRWLKCTATPSP